MRRKTKKVSVWQALNQPVVEVTDEAARSIFLAAAVILMFAWLTPGFGNGDLKVAATSPSYVAEVFRPPYQTLFGEHQYYESVAGAVIEEPINGQATGAFTDVYHDLADVGSGLGGLYQESFVEPFAAAATEIFDLSEPVSQFAEFYAPGFAAVRDAWLELMADPN